LRRGDCLERAAAEAKGSAVKNTFRARLAAVVGERGGRAFGRMRRPASLIETIG